MGAALENVIPVLRPSRSRSPRHPSGQSRRLELGLGLTATHRPQIAAFLRAALVLGLRLRDFGKGFAGLESAWTASASLSLFTMMWLTPTVSALKSDWFS